MEVNNSTVVSTSQGAQTLPAPAATTTQNGVQQIVVTNPALAGSQGTVKLPIVPTHPLQVNQQAVVPGQSSQNQQSAKAGVKRPFSSTGHGPLFGKVVIKNASSIQTVGGTTRINATLIQTADGRQILTDGNGRQLVSATGSPLKLVTVSQGSTAARGNVLLSTGASSGGSPVKQLTPLSTVSRVLLSPEKKMDAASTAAQNIGAKGRKISDLLKQNSVNSSTGKLVTLPSGMLKIVSVANSSAGTSGIMSSAASSSTPVPVHIQRISPTKQPLLKPPTAPGAGTVHPIQVQSIQGGKMPIMRLVSVSSASTTTTSAPRLMTTISGSKPIAPAISAVVSRSAVPNKIAIAPTNTVKSISQPRFIMPANTPTIKIINTGGVSQLAPGTALMAQQGTNSLQGLTIIPSNYLTMPAASQNQLQGKQENSFIGSSGITNSSNGVIHPPSLKANGVLQEGTAGRPRKPCNCTKSQCLKLYCDCFANGEFCHNCNCNNCLNNQDHEDDRKRAIKSCLERNPQAFHPKIGKGAAGHAQRRHNKGCNCKRSGCLKNYCECYEAKIPCSSICKCVGCKNFEESPDRKSLMHLADAADMRHQQQAAAKDKLSSQFQEFPEKPLQFGESGERLPFSFITAEVAEAACNCMLAQAEDAIRLGIAAEVAEKIVLEEFGQCLKHVINSAGRSKGPS